MSKYKKRADGRYQTQLIVGHDEVTGKRKVMTFYARSIRELDEKVAKARSELAQGVRLGEASTTFQTYAQHWLTSAKHNRSIATKEMYENALKHTGKLDNVPIKELTHTMIQEQVNECSDRPRVAEQLAMTIRQICKSAVRDRMITFSPAEGLELPRKTVKAKRAFTEAEKKAIREADYTDEERAFIMTLYCTGMRPAEVCALTWSDINLKDATITVCKSLNFDGELPVVALPKTSAGTRVIETHTTAVNALKTFKRNNSTLIVFAGEDGGYRTKSRYHTLFNHCKAKIETALGHKTEITAYYFRHNFASQLYYSNVSLKEAARLMGHEDLKMIMEVYAHLDAQKEDTKSKLNAINF